MILVSSQLVRQVDGERVQRGLRRVVGKGLRVVDGRALGRMQRQRRQDARQVDDAAGVALAQQRQQRLRQCDDGKEVGLEGLAQHLSTRSCWSRCRSRASSITPALLMRMSSRPNSCSMYFADAARSASLTTSSLIARASTPMPRRTLGRLLALGQVARADQDRHSKFAQLPRRLQANALVRASNQRNLARRIRSSQSISV